MSRLTVNTNDLESEGLDLEDVILEGGNIETAAEVDLEGGDLEVGIGGGGADGVGIQSIEQTTTSTEDGGINEITQTLTNGTTAVFQIRNGQRGSQGIQGEKGDAGEDWIPTQQELASIASSAAALVTVPTKTSELTNDSHFVDDGYVLRKTADMAAAIDDMRGEANGIASLDANGKVPSSQLPSSGGGGDTNVIEVVKVNGTALTPDSNKAVDVSVPTEQTVSGWGFTKNTGTYSKPSGGIPKTDLESSVQTSLGKADTALQSFTESDPTVPSWAKQSTKPTYTASEVGALPASTTIPSALADLSADSTHRTVTDAEKTAWNNKSNFSGSYNDLADKPTIPSALADLSADSTHRTVTDTEKSNWNNKSNFSGSYNDLSDKPTIPTVPSNVSAFTNDSHYVASTAITNIVSLTQAQYDALATKDANTLYIIPES